MVQYTLSVWNGTYNSDIRPGFQLPHVLYQHPCHEVSVAQLQTLFPFLSLPVSMASSVSCIHLFLGVSLSGILTSHLGDSGMKKRPKNKIAQGMIPAIIVCKPSVSLSFRSSFSFLIFLGQLNKWMVNHFHLLVLKLSMLVPSQL